MQVTVKEHKVYNGCYGVTSASLAVTPGGIQTSKKGIRLYFIAKDYGISTWPINFDKLQNAAKIDIVKSYIDDGGCFMSTKAYEAARQLGIA